MAIGIGINVRVPDVPQAAGLGARVRRRDALEGVVGAARAATAATGWLTLDELRRYRSRDALAGRNITQPGQGRVTGIADSGALQVETDQGVQEYRAGTIMYAEDV